MGVSSYTTVRRPLVIMSLTISSSGLLASLRWLQGVCVCEGGGCVEWELGEVR